MNQSPISVVLSAPTSVDLAITKRCNHKCIHCYNPWRTQSDIKLYPKSLSGEEIQTIVDELVKNRVFRVTLTGGEPLCDLPVLYRFIDQFHAANIHMGMNSNLTLMTDEVALSLMQHQWNSIILTSIPGLSEEICDKVTQVAGSYERILHGIDTCYRHDIPVGINIVVSKLNVSDLEDLEKLVKEHHITYVSITRAIAPVYALNDPTYYLDAQDIKHMAELLMHLHNNLGVEVGSITPFPACVLHDLNYFGDVLSATCAAGTSRCSIDAPSGEIQACTHEEKVYGNIYTGGLSLAWKNMVAWRTGENLHPECHSCKALPLCGGECRIINGSEQCKRYLLNNKADFPPLNDTPHLVAETTHFTVSDNIWLRDERPEDLANGNRCVIRCGINEIYVSASLLNFCRNLQKKKSFYVSDLFDQYEKNEALYQILSTLERIGALRR